MAGQLHMLRDLMFPEQIGEYGSGDIMPDGKNGSGNRGHGQRGKRRTGEGGCQS